MLCCDFSKSTVPVYILFVSRFVPLVLEPGALGLIAVGRNEETLTVHKVALKFALVAVFVLKLARQELQEDDTTKRQRQKKAV